MPGSRMNGKHHFSCCVRFSCSSYSREQAGASEQSKGPLFIERSRGMQVGVFWNQGFRNQQPVCCWTTRCWAAGISLGTPAALLVPFLGGKLGHPSGVMDSGEVSLSGVCVQRNVAEHRHSLRGVLPLMACLQLKHTLEGLPVQREIFFNAEMFF